MAHAPVRNLIENYKSLQDVIAILGMDELSEDDKLTAARARTANLEAYAVLKDKVKYVDFDKLPVPLRNTALVELLCERSLSILPTPR